jgi:nicotinamide riboside kinase
VPPELEQMIAVSPFDLFLLCAPDLEWKPDNVRENGGEMRLTLFRKYENELILRKFSYEIVTGIGNQRLQNALHIIETFFTKKG